MKENVVFIERQPVQDQGGFSFDVEVPRRAPTPVPSGRKELPQ